MRKLSFLISFILLIIYQSHSQSLTCDPPIPNPSSGEAAVLGPDGNVYSAVGNVLYQLNSAGMTLNIFPIPGGPCDAMGMDVDVDGNICIACNLGRLECLSTAGAPTRTLNATNGGTTHDLGINKYNGDYYLVNWTTDQLDVWDKDGNFLRTITGGMNGVPPFGGAPHEDVVIASNGDIFISGGVDIIHLDPLGNFIKVFPIALVAVWSLAIDGDDNIYLSANSAAPNANLIYDTDGNLIDTWTGVSYGSWISNDGVLVSSGWTDGLIFTCTGAVPFTFAPIPTMSQWGIIILGLSFLIIGFIAIRFKAFSIG